MKPTIIFIFLVAIFAVIFTSKSDNEKKDITQNVEALTQTEQANLVYAWDMDNIYNVILSNKNTLKNPYENKSQIYRLKTMYLNDTIIDFGDSSVIYNIKCLRYEEMENRIKTLITLNKPCKE